jgi:hypothetical protein
MGSLTSSSTDSSPTQPDKPPAFTKHSLNVMEVLVSEEVENQLNVLPHKVARQVNPAEVTAFTLNRLPALYATSKRGWQRQWKRGKGELHPQIATAVRQGIVAVQRDPLHADSPLTFAEADVAQVALEELKHLMQCEQLSWQNLPSVVKLALMDTLRGKITWAAPRSEIFDWEEHPHHQKS